MDRFVIRLPKPESPRRERLVAKPAPVEENADRAGAKPAPEVASAVTRPLTSAATPPSPAFRSGRRLASCGWWRSLHHLTGSVRERRALAISTVADHEMVVFERTPSPELADVVLAEGLAEEASRDAPIQHIAFDELGVLFAVANALGVISIFDYSEADMALAHIRNAMATNSLHRLPPEGHVSVHPVFVISGPRHVQCIQWNDSGIGNDRENELVVASSQHRHLWYYDVATLPTYPCVLLVNGESLEPGGVGRGTGAQGYLCARFLKIAAQPAAGGVARPPATAATSSVGGGGARSERAGIVAAAGSTTHSGPRPADRVFDVCTGTCYDAGHAPPPRLGQTRCAFTQTPAWLAAKEAPRHPPQQLTMLPGAAKGRGGAVAAASGGSTAGAAATPREVRVVAGDTTGKVRLWVVPERAVRDPPPPIPHSRGPDGRPTSPGGSPRAARRLKPAWEVAVVDVLNIAVALHKAAQEEEERMTAKPGRGPALTVRALGIGAASASVNSVGGTASALPIGRVSSAVSSSSGGDPLSSSFNTGVSVTVQRSIAAARLLLSPPSSDDGAGSSPPTLLRRSWRSDQLQVCEVFQGQGPLASSHIIAVTTGGVVATWDTATMTQAAFATRASPTPVSAWDASSQLAVYISRHRHLLAPAPASRRAEVVGSPLAATGLANAEVSGALYPPCGDDTALLIIYANGWVAEHDLATGKVRRACQPEQSIATDDGDTASPVPSSAAAATRAPPAKAKRKATTTAHFVGTALACRLARRAPTHCPASGMLLVPQARTCVKTIGPRPEEVLRVGFRGSEGAVPSREETHRTSVVDMLDTRAGPRRAAAAAGAASASSAGGGGGGLKSAGQLATREWVTAAALVPGQEATVVTGDERGRLAILAPWAVPR